ncbi:hypothetical protein B566_EDAN002514 [Ephemera danica]|nr:hypothetical protein B566_EDAN002514 [Ephemera danica]
MFYGILAEPLLKRARILLVLTKMDVSYRQMRNEALLMLQMVRLQRELTREIAVLEASAMTGEGTDKIMLWLQGKSVKATPKNTAST